MDIAPTDIDIDTLPTLEIEIGMVGATRHVEVGGQVCHDTGVVIFLG